MESEAFATCPAINNKHLLICTQSAHHLLAVCAIISISSILDSQGFQRQKVFDSGKELGFHSGGICTFPRTSS
jgi:hypothetical protein